MPSSILAIVFVLRLGRNSYLYALVFIKFTFAFFTTYQLFDLKAPDTDSSQAKFRNVSCS